MTALATQYVHNDHKARPCTRSEMLGWMGKDRRAGLALVIFDVLTEEQQAKVLAHYGWRKLPAGTEAEQ